jgi:serine/threonine protein kinase
LLHAFEDKLPKVLKIPQYQDKVLHECSLYESISKDSEAAQALALVPVRILKLSGHYVSMHSPCKALTCGILMPPYVCTLSDIPKPISESTALEIINRIGSALQFINQKKWLHGDVKPSNIFVDYHGDFWLGDYGSSLKLSDVMNYTGGTPKYQINEFPVQSLKFDLIGLGLSLLECLGLINLNCNGNDILIVRTSIEKNRSLKDKILSLFP